MADTTWILVADRSGARVYASHGNVLPVLVETIAHPEGRLRPRELDADEGGRVHDRFGEHRHAVTSRESPVDHVATTFAKALADRLREARLGRRYDSLVLVAGPRMLGRLRDALDDATAAAVSGSLDRDLAELDDHALAETLREHFARPG